MENNGKIGMNADDKWYFEILQFEPMWFLKIWFFLAKPHGG